MDLVSFIPGIGPTAPFSPGASTPPPFNVQHIGATDGTSPTNATNNMAEIYNRPLLNIAATVAAAGLTIDPNNWTQLPAAVTAIANRAVTTFSSSITTPPQFDNDMSIATTEFVTRALGNHGIRPFYHPDGWTLDVSHVGNMYSLNGGVTRIDPAGMAAGSTLSFYGAEYTSTLMALGGSRFGVAYPSPTTVVIPPHSNFQIVWDGNDNWIPLDAGPFRNQRFSAPDASAVRLESGLIVQWGQDFASIGETSRSISYPISFPSGIGNIMLTGRNPTSDSTTNCIPQVVSAGSSHFVYYNQSIAETVTPAQNNQGVAWLALGW